MKEGVENYDESKDKDASKLWKAPIWLGYSRLRGPELKVSATLQDRLRADRSSFCCFHEKPYEL